MQQPITLQVLIKVVERIERLVSGLTESYRKNRINAWLRSAAQAAVERDDDDDDGGGGGAMSRGGTATVEGGEAAGTTSRSSAIRSSW